MRSAIVRGDFQRGERLPNERDLAQQFGVSQPTMREAVRALEAMGLVESRHGSGAYVAGDVSTFISNALQMLVQLERVGILDVVELRSILGKHSAARAARLATDELIDQADALERRLTELSVPGDYEPIGNAALAFQAAVSAAGRSPLLFSIEVFLSELLIAFQVNAWRKDDAFTANWQNWRESLHHDRRRLVDAIRAHDEAWATEAMDAYLESQKTHFSSYPALRDLDLADSNMIARVAAAGLRAPAYRDLYPLAMGER